MDELACQVQYGGLATVRVEIDVPPTPPDPNRPPPIPKTPPAPTTPTDEPPPEPVDDPPAESEPRPPYTVEHKRLRWMRTGSMLQPAATPGRQVG